MKTPAYKSGMTLVETLIAVAVVGVLATAVFVPAVTISLRCKQNAECAHKLRTAVAAFELYASETGGYPPNRQAGSVPPEMADYYSPISRSTGGSPTPSWAEDGTGMSTKTASTFPFQLTSRPDHSRKWKNSTSWWTMEISQREISGRRGRSIIILLSNEAPPGE